MRSALGAHAGLIKASLQQGKTAPLDNSLLNLSGYPRRAARVSDLRPEALSQARAQLSAANGTQTGAPTIPLSDTTLRTAALLFDVCREALLYVHQACATNQAPSGNMSVRRHTVAVELEAIVPGDWSPALTRQTIQALHKIHHAIAAEQGEASSVALQITTRRADGSDAAYRGLAEAIDRLNSPAPSHLTETADSDAHIGGADEVNDHDRPAVVIVAAAHSSIRDEPESSLAAAGEAAVALILGSAPYADPSDVAISAPGFASRVAVPAANDYAAADASDAADQKQTDAALPQWEALTAATLRAATVSADAMGAVFSDTGNSGPNGVRVSTLWTRTVAQLPARGACLSTDAACGETGAAGALLNVALAAADTAAHGYPALAVTLSDRLALAMLVTRPTMAAASTAPDLLTKSDAGNAAAAPNAAQTPAGAAESPDAKDAPPPPDQSQPLAA